MGKTWENFDTNIRQFVGSATWEYDIFLQVDGRQLAGRREDVVATFYRGDNHEYFL
jgi:hypothetical protein